MENKKEGYKWIIMTAVVVMVVIFCLLFFRVQKVSIEGNTYYGEKQMGEMFQTNIFEKNLLTFWLMDKLSLTPEIPFVREYEVSYPSPNEIHIKLYEKTIVAGIAYTNQYIYFDKDGMVLRSSDKPEKDIPLFETKTVTTFSLYSKVDMEDELLLAQIMNLANLFQHYGVTWDKVQFDDNNAAFLYSGDIKVALGKKDNYDEAISALASLLEQAQKQQFKGEIDMTDYKVKGDVIFKRSDMVEKKK